MNDLISRQAAIEALGDEPLVWTGGEYELGLRDQWRSDVGALKALPSVQQWILCSERLPKDFQAFYATCRSNIDNRENWVIEGYYTPQSGFNPPPLVAEGKAEIIAWMPKELPAPYKEDNDGKMA